MVKVIQISRVHWIRYDLEMILYQNFSSDRYLNIDSSTTDKACVVRWIVPLVEEDCLHFRNARVDHQGEGGAVYIDHCLSSLLFFYWTFFVSPNICGFWFLICSNVSYVTFGILKITFVGIQRHINNISSILTWPIVLMWETGIPTENRWNTAWSWHKLCCWIIPIP